MNRILASLTLLVGLASAEAMACLCSPEESEQPLERSDVAFVGRPIKIEVVAKERPSKSAWQAFKDSVSEVLGAEPAGLALEHPGFLDSVRVTFEVSEYLKGTGPRQFLVMTGYGGADCGLPVSISKKYSIYARRINGELRTSYCFGSMEYVRRSNPPPCNGS